MLIDLGFGFQHGAVLRCAVSVQVRHDFFLGPHYEDSGPDQIVPCLQCYRCNSRRSDNRRSHCRMP